MKRLLLTLLILYFVQNCTTFELSGSDKGKNYIFLGASNASSCTPKSYHIVQGLWGLFPVYNAGKWLQRIDLRSLASNENASYRFQEKYTALDMVATFLGGWIFTLTKKTLFVEECPLNSEDTKVGDVSKVETEKKGLESKVTSLEQEKEAWIQEKEKLEKEVQSAKKSGGSKTVNLKQYIVILKTGELLQGSDYKHISGSEILINGRKIKKAQIRMTINP